MSTLTEMLERISDLEKELVQELAQKHENLLYTIEKKKIRFSAEVQLQHELLVTKFSDYVYDSGLFIILTIPIIWLALVPALFLDLVVVLFQVICFPVYGIPRVKRSQYIVIDRHGLSYLNWLEKLNCMYCGYFNGLMSFVREVAARTEQYWCPVRHARPLKSVHSRYKTFFDYGDAEGYRDGLEEVRKKFDDVQ
ncbi:hypothetical protein [Pseudodesulfovibrio sediminis]|uniref:Uncharacterized protein n=1 Tax=Pseudodesulfovibrio sediminis TaxID=2810563 RepID=A0ABN6EV78_9BACT|nr:hypothetical protein [Pseudodesulfovibrio sediminis]BCS89135.1 hypothetical protein PSDVSF_23770 [Pseudodesulfovibrio sediminis]